MEKRKYVAPDVTVIELENVYAGLYDNYEQKKEGMYFVPSSSGGYYMPNGS